MKLLEKVKERLWRLILDKESTPLPFDYLMITFLAEIVNGITSSSVFSYLPKLVQRFGISEENTGSYVGYISSSMMLSSSIFSFLIGYLTDHYNKKHVLFFGCVYGMIASLSLGFAHSIKLAWVVRFLQGVPCILIPSQSMLFERCNSSNKVVAMAFSLSAYSCGLVLGPVIGGFFSFPVENISSCFKGTIFDRFPILLPNILVSICFASLAARLLCFNYSPMSNYRRLKQEDINTQGTVYGLVPRKEIVDENLSVVTSNEINSQQRSKLKQVLSNKNVWMACISYILYAFVAIGFNEMYAVWASTTIKYHGLEFSTKDIGTSLLVAAVPLILLQVIVLSNLSHVFGVRKLYLGALLAQSIFYILYPVLYLVEQRTALWILLCVLNFLTRIAVGASFTSVTVLLNNSVGNELIGTVNGLGVTSASVSSALSPTIFGMMYTWSLSNVKGVSSNNNPLGFPFDQYFVFVIMSLLCLGTSVVVCFVKDLSKRGNQES